MLNKKDYYGYELVETLTTAIEVSEGTIYPLLRRLHAEGYCSTYLQESAQGPPRKYYCITPEGREAYAAYLAEWKAFATKVMKFLGEDPYDTE